MQTQTMSRATPKQIALLETLLAERVVSAEQLDWYVKRKGTLSIQSASKMIAALFLYPKKQTELATPAGCAPLPDVPEGRYAIDNEDGATAFYHVDRPTEGRWKGFTFVNVRCSDERYPIKNFAAKLTILKKIAEDPKAAAIRFGKELGECSVCGRSLTDEDSRNAGIGPVCAKSRNW